MSKAHGWMVVAAAAALMAAGPAAAGEKWLYSFKGGSDGASPVGGLIVGKSGLLYGTTSAGGGTGCGGGCGTVFELDPVTQSETPIYSFTGGADGGNVYATLAKDNQGNLYGTAAAGGTGPCTGGPTNPPGCGTVFKLTRPLVAGGPWTFGVLYSFKGVTDGEDPAPSVVRDTKGRLFGMTTSGGKVPCTSFFIYGCGTVFELTSTSGGKAWKKTTILDLSGPPVDGVAPPQGPGLTLDAAGDLYGVTEVGAHGSECGITGCGTVFELTPPTTSSKAWTETVLWSFAEQPGDGGNPEAGLVVLGPQEVMGETAHGGGVACGGSSGYGCGVVFHVTGAGSENLTYQFNGGSDGSIPSGGLTPDGKGNFYGVAVNGGAGPCGPINPGYPFSVGGCGVVFKLTSTGGGAYSQSVVYTFQGGPNDGGWPVGGLLDQKGVLYGTTQIGGAYGYGGVYEITP